MAIADLAILIAQITDIQPQLPAKDIELVVRLILKEMSNSFAHSRRIKIRGLGSFELNYRPPRDGRNPKTGERVQISAKHVPHFRSGKELRERVDSHQ